MKEITITEEKIISNRERLISVSDENGIMAKYYFTEIDNIEKKKERDKNKTISSMKKWGLIPESNYTVIFNYLSGDRMVLGSDEVEL